MAHSPKRVVLEKQCKEHFNLRLSQDEIQTYCLQALLSSQPSKALTNNLQDYERDAPRLAFSMEQKPYLTQCFDKLHATRVDHANNSQLIGILTCALLGFVYDQFLNPASQKKALNSKQLQMMIFQMEKFLKRFRPDFPVFKKFIVNQGVKESLSLAPTPIDDFGFYRKVLCVNDFANDSVFMTLYYFVTLFSKTDQFFKEKQFHKLFFDIFVFNRYFNYCFYKYVLFHKNIQIWLTNTIENK